METDAGLWGGSGPTGPPSGAVLPSAAVLGSGVAGSGAAAGAEESDPQTPDGVGVLQDAGVPPGIINFRLPSPVLGPGPDSGLVPLKLADLLRQLPLSQSALDSGRMEMVFACASEGSMRAQFWRLKAGADARGRSPRGGSRAPETAASEQKCQQRQKDLQCHARESLKRVQDLLVGGIPPGGPLADGDAPVFPDEALAERAVMEYVGRVAAQERAAAAAFWAECSGVRVPPNAVFEPWLDIKTFMAADCLRHPLEAAGRRWFQAAYEARELEQVLGRRSRSPAARAETLKRVRRIQQRSLRADFAWNEYAALNRGRAREGFLAGDDPAAVAAEWLVAWVAATVGEAYLRPLLARSSPGAGPEQLRRELLQEIRGGVWSLGADALPVPAFSVLPVTVARGVRDLHTGASDLFGRLNPEAQRYFLSLGSPPLDPQAALLGGERAALLRARVQSLPLQQQRALELTAAGLSRREAAAAMRCGEESVKEHLSRARRRLRAEPQALC